MAFNPHFVSKKLSKCKENIEVMKKFLIAIALMMAATSVAFADDNSTNNTEAYKFNINQNSLANTLDMSSDQIEICHDIIREFENDMMFASSTINVDSRKSISKNAVDKNLKYMRMFLNDKQYKKYVMLLNTTLVNRGLIF